MNIIIANRTRPLTVTISVWSTLRIRISWRVQVTALLFR